MAKRKQVRLDIPKELSTSKERAEYLVKICKEREKKMDLISVRIDNNTIRLMPKDKAEKIGLNFKIGQL